jgi:hypothetical protein
MRFSKFLMQAFVCLLVTKAGFAQAPAGFSNDVTDSSSTSVAAQSSSDNPLSPAQIQDHLAQAKQVLNALAAGDSDTIYLSAFDRANSQMQVLALNKDSFLTKGAEYVLPSKQGETLRVRIVRPNGVNTAVTVTDPATGKSLFPLMVRYPIEKDGAVQPAFYVSAHPALMSPELAASGEAYVTTMIDRAAQDLASQGVVIPRDIVDVAAHLVIVEHTDHKRFLNESRPDISREVLTLYALNRGDTYRYSVSSAGAGGMIQMIPKTYNAIREHHPNVALEPDFVTGMQNHANALKAMLLYINDTWKYLQNQDEVQQALQTGTATKTELLAAGYNSNPYKIPSYLSDGGSGWRSLIPAETQMYLAIYQSVDSNVDFQTGETSTVVAATTVPILAPAASLARETTAALVSWVGNLLSPSLMLNR